MQWPSSEIVMNAVHNTKIIYIALCENFIIFRLTFLLSKIVFFRAHSTVGMSKATDSLLINQAHSVKRHHNVKTISNSEGKRLRR